MSTITLSISEKIKKNMDSLPEINWSVVLRKALEKRADELLKFEKQRRGK